MNEIFEFIRLESQLALVLGQILTIVQRRLTIAQENTANRIVQVVQGEQTLVGIVRI